MKHSVAFYFLLATGLIIFVISYDALSPILLSFILVVLVSLALNPLVLRLRTLTGGRRLATALATLVFVGLIGLTGWAFSVPIKNSTTKLAQRLPEYWERLQRPVIKLEKQAAVSKARMEKEVTKEVERGAAAKGEHEAAKQALDQSAAAGKGPAPDSLRSGVLGVLQGAAGGFKSVAYSTAQIVLVGVTVFFGVVFTLMNPRPIFQTLFGVVPAQHHNQALRISRRIARFVPTWALSTLLGMLIIGLLVFLIMWPIFGFTDALILGVISGVLEAIPYLGPILSAVPGLLLAMGEGGMTPIWVLLGYIVVQALENNVILPLVMAKGMKLHPVAVIFSMLLCVAAFGLLGVLIAAPAVAIIQILHEEIYRKRFLRDVSDEDLEKLARQAMLESSSSKR